MNKIKFFDFSNSGADDILDKKESIDDIFKRQEDNIPGINSLAIDGDMSVRFRSKSPKRGTGNFSSGNTIINDVGFKPRLIQIRIYMSGAFGEGSAEDIDGQIIQDFMGFYRVYINEGTEEDKEIVEKTQFEMSRSHIFRTDNARVKITSIDDSGFTINSNTYGEMTRFCYK